MRDPHAMRHLVSGKEIVFNLAGQVSHIDSMRNPFQDLEINTTSQLQLLELCRHHNPSVKVIFTSTRQVYGKPKYLPVDENHPICPTDLNGIHKLSAEYYHNLYHQVYGLPTIVLRLTNTYGPRQLVKHDHQGFTGTFIRHAVQGKMIQLFGTGEQKRDFNYIDDVVDALLVAGVKTDLVGKTYNLGALEVYSLKDFVLILKEFSNFDFEIIPFPEEKKKIDIGDYFGDFTAFKKDANWSPQIGLVEGLEKSIRYYQEFGKHYWE